MINQIKINPSKGNVSVNIVMKGRIVSKYYFDVFKKDSNEVVQSEKGNNKNDDDDRYELNGYANDVIGRLLVIDFSFKFLEEDDDLKVQFELEFYQNNEKLDTIKETIPFTSHRRETSMFVQFIK